MFKPQPRKQAPKFSLCEVGIQLWNATFKNVQVKARFISFRAASSHTDVDPNHSRVGTGLSSVMKRTALTHQAIRLSTRHHQIAAQTPLAFKPGSLPGDSTA